jgi:predicted P-loop ATPase
MAWLKIGKPLTLPALFLNSKKDSAMKKNQVKGRSKTSKTKKSTDALSSASPSNTTRKIIESLKAEFEFRLNIGNMKVEFRHRDKVCYRDLTDCDLNSLKVWLNLKDISCSKETLRSIIFSNQWPMYDPYRSFLEGLPEWDGHDYISDLARTVVSDDERFLIWSLRKWLVGLVASLADDEAVNQIALIFCGKQGLGKSFWFRHVIPPELRKYVSAGYLDPRDKESLIQLSELVVFIMDEIENLKAKNVEAIKELMTKSSMYLRRAYTSLSQNYVRRCSFCGTANGTEILHDASGNRRFLCHNLLDIVDYELKGFNLNQLYAQAYHLYNDGFQYWLDAKEQAAVEKQNARFRSMSLEEELITTYYEPCQDGDEGVKRMQAHEVQEALQSRSNCGKLNTVAIGKILSAKGFIKRKSNGISKWFVKEKK